MLKLKDRITILKDRTTSQDALNLANAALDACNKNGFMDSAIAESLVKDLEGIDDKEVKNFIAREQRFVDISNLGVKEAYQNLLKGDLMHYPTIKPMIESMKHHIDSLPEYVTAPHFIGALEQYSWNTDLKNDLTKIAEAIEKYQEDIKLTNFIHEFKNSSGYYLSKMFMNELDSYFIDRTEANRKNVLEKINPYLFDANIKQLHSILLETENGFQIDASGEVLIEKLYSPVLINESSDIFFASGRFLQKTNEKVNILTEEEFNRLPKDFVNLCVFMSQPNVTVYENKITVMTESGNKKVEIITEKETPILKLNDKEMSYQTFTKYFMNEGVFRKSDNTVLQQIAILFENVNNIYEIDYAKRIVSKLNKSQWIDIFKTNENISIVKVDESQKINEFITNINATQTKGIVLEHLRYDISESLQDLLPAEKAKLENLTKQKSELIEAIKLLTDKKISVLEQIQANPILKASKEVATLIEAIDIELDNLKEQSHAVNNMIKSLSTVGMFSKDELNQEEDTDKFWKVKENQNKTLYFAQEDNGKFVIGKQTFEGYKNNQSWDLVEHDLTSTVAIAKAKQLAENDENGLYVETDDSKLHEEKDADGVDKLNNQNKQMHVNDDSIKKNEDLENPLESGDTVRLKNGGLGVVQGNDGNNNTIIVMEDGKSVSVPQEYLHEIEIIKKKSLENEPEIKTTDGAQSVDVRESADTDWVPGELIDKNGKKIEDILVYSVDYTGNGDNQEVKIKTGKKFDKEGKALKKFVTVAD